MERIWKTEHPKDGTKQNLFFPIPSLIPLYFQGLNSVDGVDDVF